MPAEAARAPAPGGLALVQAFANTVDVEAGSDELASPERAAAWFATRGLLAPRAERLGVEELERAVALRGALRALLRVKAGGQADGVAASALDEAARRAGLTPRFTADGSVALVPAAGGLDGALGLVVAAAEHAMRDGTWPRLKLCAGQGCAWAFYDTSRNRSGRWCSMALCGNRDKSRRAYRRRRAAAG